MFEDGPHGANMQRTSILMSLHTAALMEGHLPRVLHIGADNTPKETNNSTTMACIIWLLCILRTTALFECQVHFLMVGHTHNEVAPLATLMCHSNARQERQQPDSDCSNPARTGSSPGWPRHWLAKTTSRFLR